MRSAAATSILVARRSHTGTSATGELALAQREAVRGILSVAAISLLCSLAILSVPIFNMELFNRVLPTRNLHTLVAMVLGLGIVLLIFFVMDQLRSAALAVLADRLVRRLSLPLLRSATLAAAGPEQNPGVAAGEALRDLETLRQFIASPVSLAPFDLVWTPVLILVLLVQHWAYALLASVSCAVLLALNFAGDAVARRQLLDANAAEAQAVRDLAGAARAGEAVLAMGMLPALARRWERAGRHALASAHLALSRSRGISTITRVLRMGMTAAMVALGLVLAINDLASSGSMIAGNMILSRILLPFEQIANTRRQWIGALAAWRRVRAAVETSVPRRYGHALPRPAGALAVERLVYFPPGRDRAVLRGVSFHLRPGEVLGVIGPSGGGKSTLLRLILGMAEPTAGGVFLDGHSTFLWERADLARHVGYVPQSVCLLDCGIADNIARLDPPDPAQVMAAARLAGAHDMIARLPEGYATRAAGHVLSAGQRQRIALARALYGAPRLIVLDEPSAFLDEHGEARLVELLRELPSRGIGAMVVTHRPSLIASCDSLMVLRDGMVDRYGAREDVLRALSGPPVRLLRAAHAEATA